MLIYNTTYQLENDNARNFVIWIHEVYMPQIVENGLLKNPRLTRILSHHDQETECFSLQWEVEDTKTLHAWFVQQGDQLSKEMQNVFENKVMSFSTLMETIE